LQLKEQLSMNQTEQKTSSTDQTENSSPEFEGGNPHYWSRLNEGLVYETYENREDGSKKRIKKKIGNHLIVKASITNLETGRSSLLLEFQDAYNEIKQIQIERSLLSSNQKLLEELDSFNYFFNDSLKKFLVKYLRESTSLNRYQITAHTGWDDAKTIFITPTKTYGNPNLFFKTIYGDSSSPFNQKGTLEDWKTNVAIPSKNSSRLIFAIGCALAAPLLSLFDIESGGFHFFGESSKGKTLMIKVASSAIGNPSKYIQQWRSTTNGLESVAAAYNELFLPLDELGQIDSKDVGNIIYMLANGKGKIRSNRSGDSQTRKEWKLLLLSTGEITIKQKISDCGNNIKAGQEVRMVDIPACHDQLSELGIFESIEGYESSEDLAEALKSASNDYYGAPFDTLITRLISIKNDEWIDSQSQFISGFSNLLTADYGNDHIIYRVAKRFSLISLALNLAIDWDILPYTKQETSKAISLVFHDWINHRGGAGNIEIKQAVERLMQTFQSNIHGNRIVKVEGNSIISSSTSNSNLLAYQKENKLYIPPSIFENELCKGINKKQFIEALEQENLLIRSNDGRQTTLKQIYGDRKRYYVINDVFSPESFSSTF
jgi:putative DNA primase/helicase